MLLQKHANNTWELVRWAIVLALALAVALMWATVASGQDVPRTLSNEVIKDARPMPTGTTPATVDENYAVTMKLWTVIDQLEEKNYPAAIGVLSQVTLPEEMQVWKHLALAAGHTQTHDYGVALAQLEIARRLDSQNPLVYYLLGNVRMAQAETVRDWLPPIWNAKFYVVMPFGDVVPNTRMLHRFAAAQAFRQAVALADNVELESHLLGVEWVAPPRGSGDMPLEVPTVRELMVALEVVDFLGQSHLNLASLDMERGRLETASNHLDSAAELGMYTGKTYRDLGDAHAADGEHREATRAYLKAMAHGGGTIVPMQRILDGLGRTLFR